MRNPLRHPMFVWTSNCGNIQHTVLEQNTQRSAASGFGAGPRLSAHCSILLGPFLVNVTGPPSAYHIIDSFRVIRHYAPWPSLKLSHRPLHNLQCTDVGFSPDLNTN